MKRILVPCDFSTPALEALKFSIALAAKSKGEVFVLKSIDLPISYESAFGIQPYTFDPLVLEEFRSNAKRKFKKLEKQYGKKGRLHFLLEDGPVAPAILRTIRQKRIDLVVMGTHGVSGLTRFVVGSNTEKVVRRSPVPVIAIRKAPALDGIRKIMFASTFSQGQAHLIKAIKTLQAFFGATLDLVFINTPTVFLPSGEVQNAMAKYVRHHHLTRYALHIWNDYTDTDGILHYAKDSGADMLLLATHGRRGLSHLLAGSVSENVVNELDMPIWTYSLKK